MIYDYGCTNPLCLKVHEAEHRVDGFRDYHPPCPECGAPCNYEFNPTVFEFAVKDGPSGTSPSKAIRVQRQMREKHERLGKRQQDRYGHLRRDVVPNYQGQQTENWREAQSMAMQDKERLEKNGTDSLAVGSTYNAKVNEEKTKSGNKVTV